MWHIIQHIWSIQDVRKKILFVLGMLVIFRFAAHVPIPGVNAAALGQILAANQILGLLNVFSGGTLENFSVVMLGVGPYITASIIFQLLTMVIPYFEELSKEGEAGQAKISMYTRLATIPLAIIQGFALLQLLRSTQPDLFLTVSTLSFVAVLVTVTAGTVFLLWIGELMTEKQIGNGISLLIFASIIASLPVQVRNAIVNYSSSDLFTYILFAAIAIITIVGVVIISEGQRNIPISYARQVRGGGRGAQSHLPLRLNMAGVIPIIFAVSLILFPPLVAQFFLYRGGTIGLLAERTITLFNNQLFYGLLYFACVFGFTFFYTSIVFKPEKIAENLQRQAGFVPGIRPGKETENYLRTVMFRLVFSGALFLALIAVLPFIVQAITRSQTLAIGGVSLLIVVSVAIETAKQIDAQVTMHEYDRI